MTPYLAFGLFLLVCNLGIFIFEMIKAENPRYIGVSGLVTGLVIGAVIHTIKLGI